jgi:hypothetical protein
VGGNGLERTGFEDLQEEVAVPPESPARMGGLASENVASALYSGMERECYISRMV